MTLVSPAASQRWCRKELGHVRMHGPNQQEARRHRGTGEVEAESVALMIAAAHGMDTSDYTVPYVAGWAANVDGKDPVQVIRDTGEKVRRTATEVLGQLDTIQLGNGNPTSLRIDTPERSGPAHSGPERAPERAPRVEPLPEREPRRVQAAPGPVL
ncbi:hypothetical protein V5H98_07110 [Georgenia sp. M64]|uniref:hypothetical protein n=1 Tax=Georgenia sp. M64 TaxID=3120520 RepID=UPI0030E2D15D